MTQQASSSHPLGLRAISSDWLARPSCIVAPALLGCYLVRAWTVPNVPGAPSASPQAEPPPRLAQWARIVETEAYGPNSGQGEDPAMYAYRRPTAKKAVVFGPAGVAYIYAIYGRYCCFNVVTDGVDVPSTVLIRAVELGAIAQGQAQPTAVQATDGGDRHLGDRPATERQLLRAGAGPAKLCQALEITPLLSGTVLTPGQPLWLAQGQVAAPNQAVAQAVVPKTVVQTQRIGLSRGQALPWRWYLQGSGAVSRP